MFTLNKSGAISMIWVALIVLACGTTSAQDTLPVTRPNLITRQTRLSPKRKGLLNLPLSKERKVEVHNKGPQGFLPPLVRGDREFGGNGPKITIRVRFYVKDNRVYRQIYMKAGETRVTAGWLASKPSRAEGWGIPILIYTPPRGWRVRPLDITLHPISTYVDKDHDPEVFEKTQVGRITVSGDRDGNDIGIYTRVEIDWDYVLPVVIQRHADVVAR